MGTGPRGLFPPPSFKKYLNGLGIQVDVLDSVSSLLPFAVHAADLQYLERNACSTYNLLSEEGRRVAAALYPLAPLSARTGSAPTPPAAAA